MRFISFITSDISKTDPELLLSPWKMPLKTDSNTGILPPEHVQGLRVRGKRLVSGLPSSSERPTKAALLLKQLYPQVYKRGRGDLWGQCREKTATTRMWRKERHWPWPDLTDLSRTYCALGTECAVLGKQRRVRWAPITVHRADETRKRSLHAVW